MSTLPPSQRTELDRLQWQALGLGIVALVACFIGGFFSPAQFFRSYLAAYHLYLGIALGCLAILMLYHLTGGAWGFMIRRILEASMRTLPLLAVLFAPIAYGVGYLYPWARPEVVAGNEHLKYNHMYLNAPFFWFRAALFFIVWIALAYILSTWSRRHDQSGNPQLPRKFRLLSAPGLVFYGVTITFAAIDWVMSLQPTFHSTIFAPLFAIGQLLSGHAFAVLVLAWLVARPPLADLISPNTLNDLGNLLFTFLIMWAYMAFFQFMLVWIGNLPEENIWYLPRGQAGWQWVAWAIFIFHFAVPFFLLLMRDTKRNPRALGMVAGLIVFMHLVFLYFEILPAFPDTTVSEHWMDFLTPLGLGGIWFACFLWRLKQSPVLPEHDLNRQEAVHLRQRDLEQRTREEATHHG
jgi:hypothetical protein